MCVSESFEATAEFKGRGTHAVLLAETARTRLGGVLRVATSLLERCVGWQTVTGLVGFNSPKAELIIGYTCPSALAVPTVVAIGHALKVDTHVTVVLILIISAKYSVSTYHLID